LCRLLGYVCEEPTSPVRALGATAFAAFTSLSALHGDGWGMAWRDPQSGATCTRNSPLSAAEDPQYTDLAKRELGTACLVHLRWATDGLVVDRANTHPFVYGGYALAHNGSIAPIARLERMLTPRSLAQLKGDTDSERYFHLVLQCIKDQDGDEHAGLLKAVGLLREGFPGASLNALLLTPSHLLAVHVNREAEAPLDDMRRLFGSDGAMPHGHVSAYFDMAYKVSPTAVQVISSGLPDEGWAPIPPECLLAIDLRDRHVDILATLASAPSQ
jgi:predicted glutamine amidotransferase